jgi:uncharacterized protein YcnI
MARRIVFSGLVVALLVFMAAPAWAHVTITPDTAEKGGSDVEISFRVPNEEDTASTTKLQVAIPTDHPLASALAQAVPGWTATVSTVHLAKPIHTDDGDIGDAVSEITWTADSATTAIKPNEFGKFEIIVGQLPSDTSEITFKAIQTYSNGDVVRWIETETPGGPEAEHPAPVLTLTASGEAATPTTQPTTSATTPAASTGTIKTAQDDANTAKTIGIIAIIFAVIALVAVGISMFRKRPASS